MGYPKPSLYLEECPRNEGDVGLGALELELLVLVAIISFRSGT